MLFGDKRLPERFWNKISDGPNDGCWLWTASLFPDGYAQFHYFGTTRGHRTAFELLVGKIPNNLVIDHLCRVRHCVNPKHMELVTQKENTLRGDGITAVYAKKTCCPRGHEYTIENTRRSNGRRFCKECDVNRKR